MTQNTNTTDIDLDTTPLEHGVSDNNPASEENQYADPASEENQYAEENEVSEETTDETDKEGEEGEAEGDETTKPDEKPEEDNDKKRMAGKIAAVEKQKAQFERELKQYQQQEQQRVEVINRLYNPESRYDALAQMAVNPQLYASVANYIPDLTGVSHESFLEQIEKLEPEHKTVVQNKQEITKLQNSSEEAIALAQIKARQQARLETKIPAYGQLAETSPEIADAQYETALQLAHLKANYMLTNGEEVNPSTFEQLVGNELINLNPKLYKKVQSSGATQAISKMVNGAAVNTPNKTTGQLTAEEQELYKSLTKSFTHEEAMKIIKN
jgi:hypothetical protein